ncbi:MAG TPA: hypothetical protein DDZ88_04730 [Verrucomicrobiales bacterium]|nr:hypothetical protein [Verrucomicrobiales bacterium]
MNTRIISCIAAVLVSFILHPIAAHARIGETIAECEARYGKGEAFKGRYIFKKAPMTIACKFTNDICESMMIFHTKTDQFRHPAEMSEVEIEVLLEANGQGSAWTKVEAVSVNKEWKTEDGRVRAAYYTFSRELYIITSAEMERDAAAKAAEEKAKLKGF